jgi:hypothetical protein
MMVRKQLTLTEKQVAFLAKFKKRTGESESHFIRQAVEREIKRLTQEEDTRRTKG